MQTKIFLLKNLSLFFEIIATHNLKEGILYLYYLIYIFPIENQHNTDDQRNSWRPNKINIIL